MASGDGLMIDGIVLPRRPGRRAAIRRKIRRSANRKYAPASVLSRWKGKEWERNPCLRHRGTDYDRAGRPIKLDESRAVDEDHSLERSWTSLSGSMSNSIRP
jgi:hypothetical protein